MSGSIPSAISSKPLNSAFSTPIVSRKRKAVDVLPKKEEENSSLTQSNKTQKVVKRMLRDSNEPATQRNNQIKREQDLPLLMRTRKRHIALELCNQLVKGLDLLGKLIDLIESARSWGLINEMGRINVYAVYDERRTWLKQVIEKESLQGRVTVPSPRSMPTVVIPCYIPTQPVLVFVPAVPSAYRCAQKINGCCRRCI